MTASRWFGRRPLRTQLLLVFMAIILISVTTITVFMSAMSYRLMRDAVWENHRRVVSHTATNVDRTLATIEESFIFIMSNRTLIDGMRNPEFGLTRETYDAVSAFKELLFSVLASHDGLKSAIFVSTNGSSITARSGNLLPSHFSDADFLSTPEAREAMENPMRSLWVSNDAEEKGDIYYFRGFPNPHTGRVEGVLAFVIETSLFLDQISGLAIPGGDIYIADSAGIPFLHSNPDSCDIDPPADVGSDSISDGILRVSHPIRNGWSVVSEVPRAEIFRNVDMIIRWSIVISLSCMAVSAALALAISRSYTEDLRILHHAMDTSSVRYLETISETGGNLEFRTLAATYNSMVANLEELTGNLKAEIREKTRAESALQDLNENLEKIVAERTMELRKSMESLKTAQDSLVEAKKMASMGRLVAGLAHELNTPVGVVVTGSSFLREVLNQTADGIKEAGNAGDDALEENLRTAMDLTDSLVTNIKRAADLIRTFSQVSVEVSNESKTLVNLLDHLRAITGRKRPVSRDTLQISVNGPEDLALETYPGTLNRVIESLMANSEMHGFKGNETGNFIIDFEDAGEAIVISVSDDGKGMAEEVRSQVFEPFFTTRRNRGGLGLGLHIVYNLVTQQLGGRITCESAPGQGSRFIITIPK